MRHDQVLTLVAFVGVALVALIFDKNIGFVSITAAVLLAMLSPERAHGRGQADRLADRPARRRRHDVRDHPDRRGLARVRRQRGPPASAWPCIGALVLCYVGGIVSAFASSTALLPVIIPIAIPIIVDGGISAGLFVAALAISSTIVDVSPFSTNGALMLANRPDTISEQVYYKQILTYSVDRGAWSARCSSGPRWWRPAGDYGPVASGSAAS